MKKKILQTVLSLACVTSCALGFAACDLFGGGDGGDGNDKQYAVYHLNGGYIGDPDDTEDYRQYLHEDTVGSFKPLKAKRDTWAFENWYFNEGLTEAYSDQRFEELRAQKDEVDLYAKWIDEITVTEENFDDFFKVSSRWNGGATIGNAGIYYSISPIMVFDPENSAESFEIEVNPVLTNNGSVVWNGGKSTVTLTAEADYSCNRLRKIDSSGAGIKFDIYGRTLDYELITPSFQMKLLHKVPIEIALELDGGECESETLTVNGGEKLRKDSLPTPQKSGYRFMGWYTDDTFETEYEDWVVTRPRTLYAKFTKEITVTYHMNGATEKEPQTYLSTDNIYHNSADYPERDGYKFFGYYTTPDFKDGTKFSSRTAGEEDIDLYARWEAIRTITFVTNGGSEIQPIKVADTEVPDLSESTPYKNSLEFHGWYTDAACTQKYKDTPVSGDMMLYALWVKEVQLSYIGTIKEYVDIQIVDTRPNDVLTLTLTLTIKEKYRNYDFYLSGDWYVNLSDETNQNLGNGKFETEGGMILSTISKEKVITVTGVYTATKGYGNNDATKFDPYCNVFYGYVCIPESDLEA